MTKDELIKNFEQQHILPEDPFPSAASPPSDVSGLPAQGRAPSVVFGLPSELPSLFAGENAGPGSGLPESVSASTILAQNLTRSAFGNLQTSEGDNG